MTEVEILGEYKVLQPIKVGEKIYSRGEIVQLALKFVADNNLLTTKTVEYLK